MERITGAMKEKIIDTDKATKMLMNAGSIAVGGMGGQSIPKEIPSALAMNAKSKNIILYTGGGTTNTFENKMSRLEIKRRFYYLSGNTSRLPVNSGKTMMMDYFVSRYSRLMGYEMKNKIDFLIFEATAIGENGIVPSLSLDAVPALEYAAKNILIEINTNKPDLYGLHDIIPLNSRKTADIKSVYDRPGNRYLKIKKNKIKGIIFTDKKEESGGSYGRPPKDIDIISDKIWKILTEFIAFKNVEPLQVGAGSIATSLIDVSPYNNLKIWCEIAPSKWIEKIGDKIDKISASALYTLPGDEKYTAKFLNSFTDYVNSLVLRPNYITNSQEIIGRLNAIVIQQALEIDIYGSVNVSHINGNIYNGVGGSGDFASSGKYVIVALTSLSRDSKTSKIVPLLSNVDIPKQMVDFIVTENGIADLRWKDPRERASEIINNCASPVYRDSLMKYFTGCENKHIPYDIHLAAEWFENQ